MEHCISLAPVVEQGIRRRRYIGILGGTCPRFTRMSGDSIDYDQLRVWCRDIAKVAENLDGVFVGPVMHNQTKKEYVGSFAELWLRFKEIVADEFDLFVLEGGRQILLPILRGDIQCEVLMLCAHL